MIDNNSINKLEIKSSDYNFLHQQVIKSGEIRFEDYLRHKACLKCGHDHSFKPTFNDIQSSIDHASELISLFFNGGLRDSMSTPHYNLLLNSMFDQGVIIDH
jgi:hypothetical protein